MEASQTIPPTAAVVVALPDPPPSNVSPPAPAFQVSQENTEKGSVTGLTSTPSASSTPSTGVLSEETQRAQAVAALEKKLAEHQTAVGIARGEVAKAQAELDEEVAGAKAQLVVRRLTVNVRRRRPTSKTPKRARRTRMRLL